MNSKEEIRAEIARLVSQYAQAEAAEKADFIPGKTIIPPSGKLVGGSEMQAMVDASLDCW